MNDSPLTLFSRCIEGTENKTITDYLHRGYLIEHEEEIYSYQDGSKAIRYVLLKVTDQNTPE